MDQLSTAKKIAFSVREVAQSSEQNARQIYNKSRNFVSKINTMSSEEVKTKTLRFRKDIGYIKDINNATRAQIQALSGQEPSLALVCEHTFERLEYADSVLNEAKDVFDILERLHQEN